MTSQSRFQMGKKSGICGDFPANPKNLADIIAFNAAGNYFMAAKIGDLKFQIYESCPIRKNGIVCAKKLNDNKLCPSCKHEVKNPLPSMFACLELIDPKDAEISQQATMFAAIAQKFLGMKADEMLKMSGQDIDAKITATLGKEFVFKVYLKEKCGEYEGLDWRITGFAKMTVGEMNDEAESKKQEEILIDEQ